MDSLKLSLSLEFLLGNSSKQISQISNAKQGLIYICGCYIVFYSPFVDQQVAYIKHRNSNISAITVSSDQSLLAVAQTGKSPSIFIYSIEQALSMGNNLEQKPQFILKGHKQSIDLVRFSPNGKYLISVCNSDGTLFVWENGDSVAKNKFSKPVNVLLFDWNQDLLTVGNGYVKIWKFDNGKIVRKKEGEYWMIEGKLLNFGKNFTLRNYIDSAIFHNEGEENNQKLILLSEDGFLGTISHSYDKIQKWIDLSMPKSTSLQIEGNVAFCAGENAVIKIIDLVSLSLRGRFPKPPPLNKENISKDEQLQVNENENFSTCVGITIFSNFILTLYENATIFIWTMEQQVKAFRSMITHRQKINCVSLLQDIHGDICFFATAAEDNTLRIWHFYTKCYENNRQSIDIAEIINIKRNAYCKNLTKIIYTDSEHPIIKIKPFMKKYFVCISKREFLMYSLQTFDLILHENFQTEYRSVSFKNPDIVLSLQVSEDLLYLGFNNGFLKVYKPSEQNLLKLKEIDFGDSILGLQMSGERKILVQCKNKTVLFDFESNSKTMFNGVIQSSSIDKSIFLSEEKKVIYYSTVKNRKTSQMSLVHEFDADQKVKFIASNSSLVVIVSTKDRIVIANFSSTIIYSEMMNEEITDLVITETGQLIFTGREGNIIIKTIADSKYKKIEERAKKWFQMNDMSWMDNSIWASKEMNSYSNIRKRLSDNSTAKINQSQELLSAIDRAKSINLTNILGDESIQCVQVPSVEYQYKNEQNKMSVFNPSNIAKQANQIYANVNGLLKNLPTKANEHNKINFSGDIEDDFFKSSTSAIQNKKKRIFNEESGHYPRFTNNLVQSQMAEIRQTIEESNLIKDKKRDSKVIESYPQRSKSSSPVGSRLQNHPEALSYSSEYGEIKQVNVNNSIHLSQSLNRQKDIVKKEEQIICTFKQIIEASRDGAENIDHQYLKSLVEQNTQDFKKIYLVLDKIYGQKEKMEPSIQRGTQASIMDKGAVIEQFKKMSSAYLKFLQNNC